MICGGALRTSVRIRIFECVAVRLVAHVRARREISLRAVTCIRAFNDFNYAVNGSSGNAVFSPNREKGSGGLSQDTVSEVK